MEPARFDLDELSTSFHPDNPKDHDMMEISLSLLNLGYIEPIVRNKVTGYLISGEGRTRALLEARRRHMTIEGVEVIEEGKGKAKSTRWIIDGMWIEIPPDKEGAALIALNRLTEIGGWNEPKLADLLSRMEKEKGPEGLAGTGYDEEDLNQLLANLQFTGDNEDAKPKAPRAKPPLDLIFTAGIINKGISLGADHELTATNVYCCMAVRSGWLYGIQSHNGPCYGAEKIRGHHVQFVDNRFDDYQHELHLATVKRWQPKYATVRDVMTEKQCKKAGIPYYPLEQILDWAAELEQYATKIIVIPKYDCLDRIPERYVLGYSIPTSHGGTPLPINAFEGRPIHLLGGSCDAQIRYWNRAAKDVVSLDNNYIIKQARFGSVWTPEGTKSFEELGIGRVVNAFTVALVLNLDLFGGYFLRDLPDQEELEAMADDERE